jgi:hypothetical protein
MKRKILLSLALCLTAGSLIFGSAACVSANNVVLYVDGEQVNTNVIIKDGIALVPVRDIFEELGMNVNYEELNQTVYATKKSKLIKLTVGETTYTVGDEEKEAEVAPEMNDGVVYVPIRTVSEAFGAGVEWNTTDKTLTVTTEDKESDDSWKSNTGEIYLDTLTSSNDGVEFDGSKVIITKAGDYELKGTLADGMVYVKCDGRVKLRLSGVNITNKTGPVIYADSADKLYITITENTQNTLTDGSEYADDYSKAKAAVFAKNDIEIKGAGSLTVNANYQHGIGSNDDVTIENGVITINANVNDGIHANDGVKISGGTVNITAANDGVQSEGYVEIADGVLNITTTGEIEASKKEEFGGGGGGRRPGGNGDKSQTASDGQSGDKSQASNDGQSGDKPEMPSGEQPQMPNGGQGGDRPEMPSDGQGGEMPQMPGGGQGGDRPEMPNSEQPQMPSGEQGGEMPQMPSDGQGGDKSQMPGGEMPQAPDMNDSEVSNDEDDDSISSKGIKAETTLTILSGEININSTDTAIKGDTVAVEGGKITLNSSVKKGIKAMGDLFINDGEINVNTEDEGIETKKVATINGGTITVVANEDGINAGGHTGLGVGRSTDESNKGHSIVINGGTLNVSAHNDGIDSNGSLYINGGSVTVNGPESNGDSAFDTDGTFKINGGTAIGAGSVGMVESPDEDSAQNVLNITLDEAQKGSEIKVVDEDGNVVLSFTPVKSTQSIIFSSPEVKQGKTYTVTSGGTEVGSAKAESTVTKIGNSASGFGGGHGGQGGGFGGGQPGGQGGQGGGFGGGRGGQGGQPGGQGFGGNNSNAESTTKAETSETTTAKS